MTLESIGATPLGPLVDQVSKIIIINAATEQMSGGELSIAQRTLAAKATLRSLWFATAGDIVIMPVEVDRTVVAYMSTALGTDLDSAHLVAPAGGHHVALSDEHLLTPEIVDELEGLVGRGEPWTIDPLYYTRGVVELARRLGIAAPPGASFAAQGGPDLFNRKSHFRQLAVGARLPIAAGSVATDAGMLARAILEHLPATGTVIVKKDNGAAGAGNVTITTGTPRPLPGSRETMPLAADVGAMAAGLWKDLTDAWSHAVVVECYHPTTHKFYLEYCIDEDGSFRFLNSGAVRFRPHEDPRAKELVWVGLELPGDLPPFAFASILTLSARFIALAARAGYRGPLNIDGVVTSAGEIVFNEVNARWGGCSVLHYLGERLLGTGYANRHVVSSLREVQCPPLPALLELLHEHRLHFDPDTKQGAIVLASDALAPSAVELVFIAPSVPEARRLERAIYRCLGQSLPPDAC